MKDDEMNEVRFTYGRKRNACRMLVGKREAKRSLGRPRRRRKYIEMDLTKMQDWVTSSFRHGVNEIFALLGCYAALIGS
jgi:hypothetical protein